MSIYKHSSGNSTTTKKPQPTGIILVDSDDGTRIRVFGPDSLIQTWDIGEEGTTYAPIGGRHKVRIVDSVSGFEGEVSGQILSSQTDDFLTLKGRSPKPLRLITSGRNIEVILEEVSGPTLRGDISDGNVYDVSFNFFQSNPQDTFTVEGLG